MKNNFDVDESLNIVVKSTDMKGQYLESIKKTIRKLYGDMGPFEQSVQEAAEKLKRLIDGDQQPSWNVVVGKTFGCCIQQRTKQYASLRVGAISVLIWRI